MAKENQVRKARLEEELRRTLEVLLKTYRPDRVILFGSLAQGKVHEWSDIDLAVVKETPSRFTDRIGEILRLVRPKVGLNIVVYTPEEVDEMTRTDHYFWMDEIVGKGKVLYDRAA